jgi:hypothetical protein
VRRNETATEEQEQIAVAQFLDLLGVVWFHPPNGGLRSKATAARLKAQGVKAGVPDIIILSHPPRFRGARGVAIELKRVKGGQLSPEQMRWMDDMSGLGWIVKRCNGAGEAIDFCRELGY